MFAQPEPLFRPGDRVRWSIDHTPFRRTGKVESVVPNGKPYVVRFDDGGVGQMRGDELLPEDQEPK